MAWSPNPLIGRDQSPYASIGAQDAAQAFYRRRIAIIAIACAALAMLVIVWTSFSDTASPLSIAALLATSAAIGLATQILMLRNKLKIQGILAIDCDPEKQERCFDALLEKRLLSHRERTDFECLRAQAQASQGKHEPALAWANAVDHAHAPLPIRNMALNVRSIVAWHDRDRTLLDAVRADAEQLVTSAKRGTGLARLVAHGCTSLIALIDRDWAAYKSAQDETAPLYSQSRVARAYCEAMYAQGIGDMDLAREMHGYVASHGGTMWEQRQSARWIATAAPSPQA